MLRNAFAASPIEPNSILTGSYQIFSAQAAARGGPPVPANHSPEAVFVADPTLRTSVTSLAAAVLELAPRR